jgi:hypothetical protein
LSSFTRSIKFFRLGCERILSRTQIRRSFGALPTLIVGVLLICSLPSATAQVQNGQLTGVIVDSSGAIIPNAIIRIRNPATGYEGHFESNGSGLYTAAEMIVGSYSVQVQAPGFKTVVAAGIVVTAGRFRGWISY